MNTTCEHPRPRSYVYFVRRKQASPLDRLLAGAEQVLIAGDYLTARAIFVEVLRCSPGHRVALKGLEEVRGLLARECRMPGLGLGL